MSLLASLSMFRFFFFSSERMSARLGCGCDVRVGNSVVVTTSRVATMWRVVMPCRVAVLSMVDGSMVRL